jgi:NAD(P)-dependent dehydrogenase (short-subunit alcohol dehydrogenase family)
MKDYGLDGKVALVTGAGRGMGAAIAKGFAAEGAKVIVAEVNEQSGRAVVEAIRAAGGEARFVHTDVSNPASVHALLAATLTAYGRLDCACNNAAIDRESALFADVEDSMADQIIALNFRGVYSCMKGQIKQMVAQGGGGTIVNISSVSATRPHITGSVYSGTKAGVEAMTQGAAVTYAPSGIRINMVAPGAIDTPMLKQSLADAKLEPESVLTGYSLINRFGRPQEIAEAVLWLSSSLASFTFGHVLAVDGGYLSR